MSKDTKSPSMPSAIDVVAPTTAPEAVAAAPVPPTPPVIDEAKLAEAQAYVAEAQKLRDTIDNWGPGLPGKRRVKIPAFPVGMGVISVNGVVYSGHEREMTYDTMEHLVTQYRRRLDFEQAAVLGETKRAQYQIALGQARGVRIEAHGQVITTGQDQTGLALSEI